MAKAHWTVCLPVPHRLFLIEFILSLSLRQAESLFLASFAFPIHASPQCTYFEVRDRPAAGSSSSRSTPPLLYSAPLFSVRLSPLPFLHLLRDSLFNVFISFPRRLSRSHRADFFLPSLNNPLSFTGLHLNIFILLHLFFKISLVFRQQSPFTVSTFLPYSREVSLHSSPFCCENDSRASQVTSFTFFDSVKRRLSAVSGNSIDRSSYSLSADWQGSSHALCTILQALS